MAKLDGLSGDFRSEVAERVAADYEERLRGVETELSTHRSALEESLEGRREAVEAVARDHDSRSAELEETELRHLVGEYSDEEYGQRKAEHADLIDDLQASLSRETEAVEQLATVLAEIAGAAAVVEIASGFEEVTESPSPEVEPVADMEVEGPAEGELVEEPAEAEAEPDGELESLDVPAESEVDEVSWGEPLDEDTSEAVDQALAEAEADVAAEEISEGEETMPVPVAEPPESVAIDEGDDFLDELEFLESLSIDEPVEFDSVSRLLDDEEARSGEEEPSV